MMETEIKDATASYQKLLTEDLPAFNRVLAANNVAALLTAVGSGANHSGE
jgi:hypothetical protein